MPTRRLPAPWTVLELDACFVIQDANGLRLAYVYFETNPMPIGVDKLTRDEARRVAANLAKLPDFLKPPS